MTMEPIKTTQAAYQGSSQSVEPASKAKVADDATSAAEQGTVQITQPEKVSDSSLKKAVEDINKNSSSMEAVFGYHEGTKHVTIKILDKDTREVKKEYPAEKTLDMIQKVWEMAGLMVDEKR